MGWFYEERIIDLEHLDPEEVEFSDPKEAFEIALLDE